jgi:hypothetical protein
VKYLALFLIVACRGPDSAALEPYAERTNYPRETSNWDSHGYGVGFNLQWDLGRRAEANEAVIADHELALHRKIEDERPNPVVAATKSAAGSLDGSDAGTAGTLLTLFLAWINRRKIAEGVRRVGHKIRKKKEPA